MLDVFMVFTLILSTNALLLIVAKPYFSLVLSIMGVLTSLGVVYEASVAGIEYYQHLGMALAILNGILVFVSTFFMILEWFSKRRISKMYLPDIDEY